MCPPSIQRWEPSLPILMVSGGMRSRGWGPHDGISGRALPCEDSEKAAICKPGREPPGGTELAITSTLDLQPPQLCKKSILLFRPQAVLVCYIRYPEWAKTAATKRCAPPAKQGINQRSRKHVCKRQVLQ